MGWGAFETRIDELRLQVGRKSAEMIPVISADLERFDLRPRDRSRLYGLRAQARKKLGLFDEAEEDLRKARRVRRAGLAAETEIEIRFADLQLHRSLSTGKGWKPALDLANGAVLTARELTRKPSGSSAWSRRQAWGRARLLTAALVNRGTVFFYGYGQTDKALRDAMEAVESAPRWHRQYNERRHRPWLSAYQLVCVCATGPGANAQDLRIARELAAGFQIPKEDVILRAQQRATVLCLDVKLGNADPHRAEEILRDDMVSLRRRGATTVYNHILRILVWLVREYQERPERAEWIGENLTWNGDPGLIRDG